MVDSSGPCFGYRKKQNNKTLFLLFYLRSKDPTNPPSIRVIVAGHCWGPRKKAAGSPTVGGHRCALVPSSLAAPCAFGGRHGLVASSSAVGPSGGCGEDLIDHSAPSRSEGILSTIVGPHGALTAVAETLEAETVRLEQLVTNLNLTLGEKRCCDRVPALGHGGQPAEPGEPDPGRASPARQSTF